MTKKFPYILFAVSMILFFGPFPAYVYLVMPYAEATKDPDAIEAVAWFSGIFLMFLGAMLAPVSFGGWLYTLRKAK